MSINYGDLCRPPFRPLPPPPTDLAALVRELRVLQRRARRQCGDPPYRTSYEGTAAAARAMEALVDREIGLLPWE